MVGKAGYGKTYFIQYLVVNNTGELQKVQWLSGIELPEKESCKFSLVLMHKINLITQNGINELDDLLKLLAMLVLF